MTRQNGSIAFFSTMSKKIPLVGFLAYNAQHLNHIYSFSHFTEFKSKPV